MRRLLASTALALSLVLASTATAADEFDNYRVEKAAISLSSLQAGAHADVTTSIELSQVNNHPYANTRDVLVELPPGLVGNPEAYPKCTLLQFGATVDKSSCPQDSQVGVNEIRISGNLSGTFVEPVYNMPAPGGDIVARFGFFAATYPMLINVRLDPETSNVIAAVEGAPAGAELISAETTFWGVPSDPSHDLLRVTPFEAQGNKAPPPGGRESGLSPIPFMTNPTSCGAGKEMKVTATSYQLPDSPSTKTAPFPALSGCGVLELDPQVSLSPTTSQGASATGIEYGLSFPTQGFEQGHLKVGSYLKRAEVTLPEGMTLNPSAAEGLGVCSEADLARETYNSGPNAGCPETSKIGSAISTSPVLDRQVAGSLYLAKPYENRFGSLLALYLVLKVPDRGVLVKLAGKVSPDPRTGQLVSIFDDIPELPVATFELSFREGARAPLITPPACGTYQAISNLAPWSAPQSPLAKGNAFAIESGPDRGACLGNPLPFDPGLLAYPTNAAAGAYTPFYMRLTRRDGDQDLTKFSATLPPGLVAKLAGVSQCPEASIAQARSRTGPREGRLELASPSCPASSEIGTVLGGAGVGSVLTYAKGKVYLAGPYKGAPLSVVAIVPAVAGPFDVGTVVTRQALRLNPRTGIVTVDGESSDPIPHILAGIPLKVRDIRVFVDRPEFTLNPTSCEQMATEATVWGGGTDVFGSADDSPFAASSRFQAADCASLAFKPALKLKLRGGTKRGGHPALQGTYRPKAGDANLSGLVLRLPRSAFLDQAHIRTICTRVQFAAKGGNGAGCPKGAIYGQATAYTPILDQPLKGSVYLRSSNNKLPDFVAALHGIVDVEAVARIDSVRGGIRATFEGVPDAPLSKVVVEMQGQRKGLIVNSRDLCGGANRANAAFSAHNGRRASGRPPVAAAGCGKAARRSKGKAGLP
ncbi:MAG TPA: hypothetical protein VIS95_03445 [Solirubrobacterales bacterium]